METIESYFSWDWASDQESSKSILLFRTVPADINVDRAKANTKIFCVLDAPRPDRGVAEEDRAKAVDVTERVSKMHDFTGPMIARELLRQHVGTASNPPKCQP